MQRAKRTSRSGFLLVEVLLGIVLFSLFGAASMLALVGSAMGSVAAENRVQALRIARGTLDSLQIASGVSFASLIEPWQTSAAFGYAPSTAGDLNHDGKVNDIDLSILTSHWLEMGVTADDGDLNGDNIVNDLDLSILTSNWQQPWNKTVGPASFEGYDVWVNVERVPVGSSLAEGLVEVTVEVEWNHGAGNRGTVRLTKDIASRNLPLVPDWSTLAITGAGYTVSPSPEFNNIRIFSPHFFVTSTESPGLTVFMEAGNRVGPLFELLDADDSLVHLAAYDVAAQWPYIFVLTSDSDHEIYMFDVTGETSYLNTFTMDDVIGRANVPGDATARSILAKGFGVVVGNPNPTAGEAGLISVTFDAAGTASPLVSALIGTPVTDMAWDPEGANSVVAATGNAGADLQWFSVPALTPGTTYDTSASLSHLVGGGHVLVAGEAVPSNDLQAYTTDQGIGSPTPYQIDSPLQDLALGQNGCSVFVAGTFFDPDAGTDSELETIDLKGWAMEHEGYFDSDSFGSVTGVAETSRDLLADINNDGIVNDLDFSYLAVQWQQVGLGLQADINNDGIVNDLDFSYLAVQWQSTAYTFVVTTPGSVLLLRSTNPTASPYYTHCER